MPNNFTRYDEMMSFLPWYYQDSHIMNGIIRGDAQEIEAVRAAILFILSQFYVDTADRKGIELWEQELGLTPARGASLGLRKAQIKAKLQRPAVMTPKRIESIVNLFVEGGAAKVIEIKGRYHFSIEIPFGALKWQNEVRQALEEAKPAHLGYDICYTLYGGLEDTERNEVSDDVESDFWTAAYMNLRDDVPYGKPIKAYKHDGTLRRGGALSRNRAFLRNGEVVRNGLSAQKAPKWGERLDYVFRPTSRSERDGTLQHDGRFCRSGEKPWRIEYMAQMEDVSILTITLGKDNKATFEDSLAFAQTRSKILRHDGEGKHGLIQSPLDSDGEITITRTRRRNGRIRRDGGGLNLFNGSMRRDGRFRRDGGGIKRRKEILKDRIDGALGLTQKDSRGFPRI